MDEERLKEIEASLVDADAVIANKNGTCTTQILVEDCRELLSALREAQARAEDAAYWCQMIRRAEGDYQEPRDAYRTFCKVSELYQTAEQKLRELLPTTTTQEAQTWEYRLIHGEE